MASVPPFLYEPPKRFLHGVGDVLSKLPLPGDMRAGPMHRVPALQWQTQSRKDPGDSRPRPNRVMLRAAAGSCIEQPPPGPSL